MKRIIKSVLDRYTDQQINLGSESARESIASEISKALDENGTYTERRDGWDPGEKHYEHERKKWVCSICGKNTYEVDWDYIGSGTNHLGCELKSELSSEYSELRGKRKKQILEIEKELYKGEG